MDVEDPGVFSSVTVAQLSVADDSLPSEQDPTRDRGADADAGTISANPRYTPARVLTKGALSIKRAHPPTGQLSDDKVSPGPTPP